MHVLKLSVIYCHSIMLCTRVAALARLPSETVIPGAEKTFSILIPDVAGHV